MTTNKVVSFFRNRFLSSYNVDSITGEQVNLLHMIYRLEDKIYEMQQEINFLKEENIENTNLIYELTENIRALDARIDIVTAEKFIQNNV